MLSLFVSMPALAPVAHCWCNRYSNAWMHMQAQHQAVLHDHVEHVVGCLNDPATRTSSTLTRVRYCASSYCSLVPPHPNDDRALATLTATLQIELDFGIKRQASVRRASNPMTNLRNIVAQKIAPTPSSLKPKVSRGLRWHGCCSCSGLGY